MSLANVETGEIPTHSPTPYQLMPGLTDEERASLRLDIEKHGIRVPIDVDEDDNILDGHHRAWIAAELNIPCPRRLVPGLTEEEKRAHAVSVNVFRRNLTREQRRDLVARLRESGMSQRAIAEATGVGKSTVDRDLHASTAPFGAVGPDEVTGLNGKTYKSTRTATEKIEQAKANNPVDPPAPQSRAGIEMRVAKAREMAAAGATSRQIAEAIGLQSAEGMAKFRAQHGIEVPADAVVGKTRRIDSNRVVQAITAGATDLCVGIDDLIDYEALDPNQIDGWVSSLSDSIRSLTTLRNHLKKELTRG